MRKISYGKIVLIIMYAFVSLFVLMFINSILEAANDDRYYNDFYSTNVRKFAVNSGKGSELQFRDLGKDYALFFDMKTTDPSGMEIDDGTRAVYFKGDLPHPTMISGRFFTQEELDSNSPVAVIGTLVERNIIERDGKKYYSYQGVNYEKSVIWEKRAKRPILICFHGSIWAHISKGEVQTVLSLSIRRVKMKQLLL